MHKYAQGGDADRALDLLDRAIAPGQGFRTWIDHDLDSLCGLPGFQEIMSRLDAAPARN